MGNERLIALALILAHYGKISVALSPLPPKCFPGYVLDPSCRMDGNSLCCGARGEVAAEASKATRNSLQPLPRARRVRPHPLSSRRVEVIIYPTPIRQRLAASQI
ncbi:hypothetical protein J6590_028427 [Homalodisca vitripennis]|nr:hypothetical protein J6590_028427 [Homalodisca vitripennis]